MADRISKVLIIIMTLFIAFLLFQFAMFTPCNNNVYWVFTMGGLSGFALRYAFKK